VVAAFYLIVMVGAAVFVHIPNGVFAADGGWELVGAIAALLLVLAAAGPGRWSVDHSFRARQDSLPPSARACAPPPQLPTTWDDSRSSAPTVTDVPLPTPSTDSPSIHRRRSPKSSSGLYSDGEVVADG
jgi:hypothetical protein